MEDKETLEEAIEQELQNHFFSNISEIKQAKYFINFGIKLQQEQDKNKFSEEEVLEILYKHTEDLLAGKKVTLEEWFEQFKKK
jgi:phosphoribosylformylglycinamidine (FGAM) synthase PurS component